MTFQKPQIEHRNVNASKHAPLKDAPSEPASIFLQLCGIFTINNSAEKLPSSSPNRFAFAPTLVPPVLEL